MGAKSNRKEQQQKKYFKVSIHAHTFLINRLDNQDAKERDCQTFPRQSSIVLLRKNLSDTLGPMAKDRCPNIIEETRGDCPGSKMSVISQSQKLFALQFLFVQVIISLLGL